MPFKNPALFDQEAPVKGFTVSVFVAAETEPFTCFWIAPAKCVVDSVVARWVTASASGTLQVAKVPSGTAPGGGTNLLSSTINIAGTANTNNSGSLSTTAATLELASGDSLQIVSGGSLTGLESLLVVVGLHWIP